MCLTNIIEFLGNSEIALEYCKKIRGVVAELLGGISQSLGLEANYIQNSVKLESAFQIFAANLYPPCPQPDLAMGLPPHSDHGLLTLLIQNGINGLQIQHQGKWINVKGVRNSFFVNTCDHLEVPRKAQTFEVYKSNGHFIFSVMF